MGRRRKVEGLTLDLTRVVEGHAFCIEDLIVAENSVSEEHREILGYMCGLCNSNKKCYRTVNDVIVCYMCGVLNSVPPVIQKLIRDTYDQPCKFCGITGVITQLDHVNMFRKKYGVLSMVSRPIEDIKAEIAKCQLLCVPCHSKVTAAERAFGFMEKKIRLNRMIRDGRDVTALTEIYAQQYDKVMSDVYMRLRQTLF